MPVRGLQLYVLMPFDNGIIIVIVVPRHSTENTFKNKIDKWRCSQACVVNYEDVWTVTNSRRKDCLHILLKGMSDEW